MEPQQTPSVNPGVPPNSGAPNPDAPEPSAPNPRVPDSNVPVPSTPGMPTSSMPPQPSSTPSGKKSAKGLLIGFIVFVIALAVAAVVVMTTKSSDKDKKGSSNKDGTSQSQSAASSEKIYTGKNAEFTVLKPEGWKLDATSDPGSLIEGAEGVIYTPPGTTIDGLSVVAVYSFPLKDGMTLDTIFQQGKEIYKDFPEYKEIEYKKFKRDGKDAAYFEVKYKLGDALLHQSQLVLAGSGKVYTVTATLPEPEWEANKAMIKSIQDSLQVK